MADFVNEVSAIGGRAGADRSAWAALEAAVGRAYARYRAWRQFRGTRKLLLRLDERTLHDVVGLSSGEIQKMKGTAEDRRRLGLQ